MSKRKADVESDRLEIPAKYKAICADFVASHCFSCKEKFVPDSHFSAHPNYLERFENLIGRNVRQSRSYLEKMAVPFCLSCRILLDKASYLTTLCKKEHKKKGRVFLDIEIKNSEIIEKLKRGEDLLIRVPKLVEPRPQPTHSVMDETQVAERIIFIHPPSSQNITTVPPAFPKPICNLAEIYMQLPNETLDTDLKTEIKVEPEEIQVIDEVETSTPHLEFVKAEPTESVIGSKNDKPHSVEKGDSPPIAFIQAAEAFPSPLHLEHVKLEPLEQDQSPVDNDNDEIHDYGEYDHNFNDDQSDSDHERDLSPTIQPTQTQCQVVIEKLDFDTLLRYIDMTDAYTETLIESRLKTLTCQYCYKTKCYDKACLLRHIRGCKHRLSKDASIVSSSEKLEEFYFECAVCNERFPNAKNLLLHGISHSDPSTVNNQYCSICVKTITDKPIFQHCIDEHAVTSKDGSITCTVCNGFTSKDRKKFRLHIFTHRTWEVPRLCIRCGNYFSSVYKYHYHKTPEHQPKSYGRSIPESNQKRKSYGLREECKICGKNILKTCLKNHILGVHVNENVICSTCGISCKNEKALIDHIRRIHGVQKECDLCGYQTNSKHHLAGHMKARHMTKDNSRIQTNKYFQCEICGKQTSSSFGLRYHLAHVHLTKKEKREKPQTTVQYRKEKLKSLTKVLQYPCEDCDFSATTKDDLISHVLIHATWPCALCKKGFFKRQHYAIHLMRIHKRKLTEDLCIGACVDRQLPSCYPKRRDKKIRRNTPIYKENGKLVTTFAPALQAVTGDIRCKFCDAHFHVIRQVITHVETKHVDEVEHKCTHCGLAFVNEYCYGSHVRKFHAIDYEMANKLEGQIDSIMRYCNVLGVLTLDEERYKSQYGRNKIYYQKRKIERQEERAFVLGTNEN